MRLDHAFHLGDGALEFALAFAEKALPIGSEGAEFLEAPPLRFAFITQGFQGVLKLQFTRGEVLHGMLLGRGLRGQALQRAFALGPRRGEGGNNAGELAVPGFLCGDFLPCLIELPACGFHLRYFPGKRRVLLLNLAELRDRGSSILLFRGGRGFE